MTHALLVAAAVAVAPRRNRRPPPWHLSAGLSMGRQRTPPGGGSACDVAGAGPAGTRSPAGSQVRIRRQAAGPPPRRGRSRSSEPSLHRGHPTWPHKDRAGRRGVRERSGRARIEQTAETYGSPPRHESSWSGGADTSGRQTVCPLGNRARLCAPGDRRVAAPGPSFRW